MNVDRAACGKADACLTASDKEARLQHGHGIMPSLEARARHRMPVLSQQAEAGAAVCGIYSLLRVCLVTANRLRVHSCLIANGRDVMQ